MPSLSEGNFANGATTAAMAFAFNQVATSNLNSRENPTESSGDQEIVAAYGEVLVGGVSAKGAEVSRLTASLTVDVFDREGSLVGFYDVELSSTLGGPSGANIRGRLSFGAFEFPTVLRGSPLNNRTDIFNAFDGAQINLSGFNIVAGAGFTFGSFSIGQFHDPASAISASGFSFGIGKLGGHASVEQVKFRPVGFKK